MMIDNDNKGGAAYMGELVTMQGIRLALNPHYDRYATRIPIALP